MNSNNILVVVVSFNGGEKTVSTIRALLGQVGHIHIVDNGSDTFSLERLEQFEMISDISITRLPANRGIGYALNLGLARARDGGFGWLLTMDQDSLADKNMIPAFCQAIYKNQDLACLAPTTIVHGNRTKSSQTGTIEYAITSGNLVRLDVYEASGPYNEAMFIDAIDFDFCLRVRKSGYEFWRVAEAVLYHELGEPHFVPAPFARFYTSHSPTRRYYMYRNFLYLAEHHIQEFPIFIIKSALAHCILLILIPFFDPKPGISLTAIWQGVRDYFSDNLGPRKGPSE